MNKFLISISVIIFLSCSDQAVKEQNLTESNNKSDLNEKKPKYGLIKDNLYLDKDGNLLLKAVNNEDFDENGNLYPKDVWLKTVYCDTCWTATENGWTDITELKDFVDTSTFHLDTTDTINGGDIYEDKNYRYFHKWMADGGTVTLLEK